MNSRTPPDAYRLAFVSALPIGGANVSGVAAGAGGTGVIGDAVGKGISCSNSKTASLGVEVGADGTRWYSVGGLRRSFLNQFLS